MRVALLPRLMLPATAQAQEAQLGDTIVVTARLRAERLLDVPVAVSVVDAATWPRAACIRSRIRQEPCPR